MEDDKVKFVGFVWFILWLCWSGGVCSMCDAGVFQVGTDILEENITAFDDYVQSMDVAAFNKI